MSDLQAAALISSFVYSFGWTGRLMGVGQPGFEEPDKGVTVARCIIAFPVGIIVTGAVWFVWRLVT